jgi:DNA-binding transcriptional MocR family regulator
MTLSRRQEVASVVRKNDAFLIEDDAYSFLLDTPHPPISSFIPERSFYVVSFAKCLAPGLRIAGLLAPEAFRSRLNNALRATGWMAAPVMAEVVSRIIQNGELERQARLKREKASLRNKRAQRILGDWLPVQPTCGFHVWLPLPSERDLNALIAGAAQARITLAAPQGAATIVQDDIGIRLCLGGVESEAELEDALLEIRRILETKESLSLV